MGEILIVDDSRVNVGALSAILRDRGHAIRLAADGPSALEVVKQTPPEVILLDIRLPGIDGYEVCRRLRAMPETAEVPIIFLSSLEDVGNKSRGFEAGANDYVYANLATDANTCDTAFADQGFTQLTWVSGALPSGLYYPVANLAKSFPVSAGANTFYVNGSLISGTSNQRFYHVGIDATFVPN